MFKLKLITFATALSTLASLASADSWTLDAEASRVAFGSIKKNTVGEVHEFQGLAGSVLADGKVTLEIDLTSVETFIDIRNERMVEHVFENAPKATISASIDMAQVAGLAVGESTVVDTTGTVALLGASLDLDTEMHVIRLTDSRAMVSTNDMIMLSTADLGLTTGIDKLMELASLPGITRVSPVTLRLVFDLDSEASGTAATAATEVTQAAVSGDVDHGKKVYRKCKACHKLDAGKNGVGPSLYQIVGKAAGAAEGFKYSKAIAESGLVWTPENLAAYLADPKGFIPNNKMAFRGLRKQEDIDGVIAYLAAN